MDYLRVYAEEYGLGAILERIAGRTGVQGAVLTIDEWWLRAWHYNEIGEDMDWERWVWTWRHWGSVPLPRMPGDLDQTLPWTPGRRLDLHWRPPGWEALSHALGRHEGMPPIRLVICLRPPKGGEDNVLPELPRSLLPVTFEVRPIARLAASHRAGVRPLVGGVSIGTGRQAYGTLGGIVEDQRRQRYAMTCAHVLSGPTSVEQPALYDDPQATAIGIGSQSTVLQPCPGAGPCNPYTNSPHITCVDSSLVAIDPTVASNLEILSIGPVAGIIDKVMMTQGQEVAFEGRTSGHRTAEVGGLAVFYRLQANGLTYCFKDLFEIRWGSLSRSLFGAVVKAGDSGAWVCAETDAGPGWCGQIVGEDRRIGYAAFAENIAQEWRKQGTALRVR